MIPTRLKKTAGDLLIRWGRTLLTLAGLSLGLFAVGAVATALITLSSDLNDNFLQTNPPSVIESTSALDPAALAAAAAIPGVREVEDRPMISARIETARNRWSDLILFVVDDFQHPRVSRFYLESGRWPAAGEGLMIEREGRFALPLPPGSPVRVRLPGGQEVDTRLTGQVFDPGQAQGRMEGILYGYVSRQTLAGWGYSLDRSRLLVTLDRAAAPMPGWLMALHGIKAGGGAVESGEQIAAALEASGAQVRRIEAFEELRHPHQFQMDAMIVLFLGIGGVALAMCAVLILNLVDSMMTAEQRAIGVMKAIGGRSGQIAADYLLAMAFLGLIAAAASAPFAMSAGQAVANGVAGMLNFKLITDARLASTAVVLGIGILTPVVVAWGRIARTTGCPVREALARAPMGQSTALADHFAGLMTPLPLIPRMALRTLVRRPRRAILTAGILALGLTFFMTALNMRSSTLETVNSVQRTRPYDLSLSIPAGASASAIAAVIDAVPVARRAEPWSFQEGVIAAEPSRVNAVAVFGAPPVTAALNPDVMAGRWLDPARSDGVVITQKLAADQDLKVGGRYQLTIAGRSAPVVILGIVKEFGGGAVYAPKALVDRLAATEAGQSNLVFVTLAEHGFSAQRRGARALMAEGARQGLDFGRIQATGQLAAIVEGHLVAIAAVLLMIAAFALFVGVLGVASSISVSVVERYREIGVLKAVGGRNPSIVGLFVCEAVLIGIVAWAIAVAVSPWLSRVLASAFGNLIIQYPFDYRAFEGAPWMALALAVAVAALASLAPIRSILKTTIHQALRSE